MILRIYAYEIHILPSRTELYTFENQIILRDDNARHNQKTYEFKLNLRIIHRNFIHGTAVTALNEF